VNLVSGLRTKISELKAKSHILGIRDTGLSLAFKLMMSAQIKWLKLERSNRAPEIIPGMAFVDGNKQLQPAT